MGREARAKVCASRSLEGGTGRGGSFEFCTCWPLGGNKAACSWVQDGARTFCKVPKMSPREKDEKDDAERLSVVLSCSDDGGGSSRSGCDSDGGSRDAYHFPERVIADRQHKRRLRKGGSYLS